jgi:hypothetical protein
LTFDVPSTGSEEVPAVGTTVIFFGRPRFLLIGGWSWSTGAVLDWRTTVVIVSSGLVNSAATSASSCILRRFSVPVSSSTTVGKVGKTTCIVGNDDVTLGWCCLKIKLKNI